jgi:hypothetical protein
VVQKHAGHRAIGKLAAAAATALGLAGFGARQAHAGLMVDFRAMTVNGSAVSDSKVVDAYDGDVVSIQIFALVQGTNAANDEGLQSFGGSIYSSGGTLGNLSSAALAAPFNGSGSQNGSQQDFDSDGDLDIGSIPTGARPAANSLYFFPRANAMQNGSLGSVDGTPVAGANPAAEEWLVGTVNFTVTMAQGPTTIEFVRRVFPNGANDPATSHWNEDGGGLRTGTSPYSSNPLFINIPEPSSVALAGLASLGLLARRKRS